MEYINENVDEDFDDILKKVSKYNKKLTKLVKQYEVSIATDTSKMTIAETFQYLEDRNNLMIEIKAELDSYYKLRNRILDAKKAGIDFTIKHIGHIFGTSFMFCLISDFIVFGTGYMPVLFLITLFLIYLTITGIAMYYKGMDFRWDADDKTKNLNNHAMLTSLLPCFLIFNFFQVLLMTVTFYISMISIEFLIGFYFGMKQ